METLQFKQVRENLKVSNTLIEWLFSHFEILRFCKTAIETLRNESLDLQLDLYCLAEK